MARSRKVAQRAAGLGGGGVHLLLRGGQNARAFLSNRCFDARLVREAFRLTWARIPAISPSRPESLASIALSRALASSVALRADSMSPRTFSEQCEETLAASGKAEFRCQRR